MCHFQVTTWDWTRAEKSFTVYEIMCKILKVILALLLNFLYSNTLREYKAESRIFYNSFIRLNVVFSLIKLIILFFLCWFELSVLRFIYISLA